METASGGENPQVVLEGPGDFHHLGCHCHLLHLCDRSGRWAVKLLQYLNSKQSENPGLIIAIACMVGIGMAITGLIFS